MKLAVYFITLFHTKLHKRNYPLLSEVSSILYYTKLITHCKVNYQYTLLHKMNYPLLS